MSPHPMRRRIAAFTLVELMIVVALVAVILALAAPSFRDMILMQRLRGINAQIVTDLQYARSEAISRGTYVHVKFQATSGAGNMWCYIIFTRPTPSTVTDCNCTAGPGTRCTDPALSEVRTVQVADSESIYMNVPSGPWEYIIDPRTGGVFIAAVDSTGPAPDPFKVDVRLDPARSFRNVVGASGRPSVCIPDPSRIGGVACQ